MTHDDIGGRGSHVKLWNSYMNKQCVKNNKGHYWFTPPKSHTSTLWTHDSSAFVFVLWFCRVRLSLSLALSLSLSLSHARTHARACVCTPPPPQYTHSHTHMHTHAYRACMLANYSYPYVVTPVFVAEASILKSPLSSCIVS